MQDTHAEDTIAALQAAEGTPAPTDAESKGEHMRGLNYRGMNDDDAAAKLAASDAIGKGEATPEPKPEEKTEPKSEDEEESKLSDLAKKVEREGYYEDDDSPQAPGLDHPLLAGEKTDEKEEHVPDEIDDLVAAEEPPGEDNDKKGEAWKRVKQQRKEALAQVKELKEENAALKAGQSEITGEEVTKLREREQELTSRISEMESQLAVAKIDTTPDYQQRIGIPLKMIEDDVNSLADITEGVTGGMLMGIVRSGSMDAIRGLAEKYEIDPYTVAQIQGLETRYRQVKSEEAAMQETANKAWEKTSQQNEEQARADLKARQARFSTGLESHFKAMQARHDLLREVPGNDAWNNTLATMKANLSHVDGNALSEDNVAEMAVKAEIFPQYVNMVEQLRESVQHYRDENRNLRKRISGLSAASPSPGGGTGKSDAEKTSGKARKADEGLSFLGSIARKDWSDMQEVR